ncbi:type II secretion system protein [Candidatus Uabimicrobium sp. HlEnr_7]|uniref:type II secretion system protein n=1 Tax=Candidatus Uabimicrobium helgolandensis TaxID=3095367 RepID=UPI003558DD9E
MKKFTFMLLVLMLIYGILATVGSIIVEYRNRKWLEKTCQLNLQQLGKGFVIYLLDIGGQKDFPDRNGQGFLLSLYDNRIIVEKDVYLCRMTKDTNSEQELKNAPDNGDASGPVSYAGRKNANSRVYPGLFNVNDDVSTTPIVSDDIGEPYNNHSDGKASNFLFFDLHVDMKYKGETDFPNLDVLAN